MSVDNHSSMQTRALGRPFKLGMLYDLRRDALIPDTLLWNSTVMSNNMNRYSLPSDVCEIHSEDTFTKRAELLGMDEHLKISVLTDLIEVFRSAQFIHSRRTNQHKQRFIVKCSITTSRHELSITHLNKNNDINQEIFKQNIATHVVTGILYGAEIYFVFERILFKQENHAEIDRIVITLLEKITTLRLFHNNQLNLNNNEEKIARSLTCRCYSDFDFGSKPTTFYQAADLFKQLPKLMNDNTIPKQVWLCPLYLFDKSSSIHSRICSISSDLFNRLVKLFEKLYRFEMIVNDFKHSLLPTKFFNQTGKQLSRFCTHIYEFEIAMKRKMKTLVYEIRSGIQQEMVLDHLLKNVGSYVLNETKLDNWIRLITEQTKILNGFFDDLSRQGNIDISDFSSLQDQRQLNHECILRLTIHLTEKHDPFLSEMFQYLNDGIDGQHNRNLNIDHGFNQQDLILIRNKIALYCEFARMNKNRRDVKFIAEQQYADDFQMKKDVSIILYHNGTAENYEISTRPGKPHATDVSSHGLTLNWLPPTHGSQNIQQYKVYVQTNTTNAWQLLLTTTGRSPLAVISDLHAGKYQFKVQGVTLPGDTADSDISDVIDILPDPEPEIVTGPSHVVPTEITNEKAILDVTPAWFEPVKTVNPDKIRFPDNYNKNSPDDVRTYDCLSTYRSMIKKTRQIDFVAEPFNATVDNTETLIVVLNELAYQLGARLTFSKADFSYKDSDYRTACGVTNLGSIHSLVTSEGNFLTAKFDLHFTYDYNEITASEETLKRFVLTMTTDIATIAQCNKDFIRVFSIRRVKSILVGFGITTPKLDETKKIADSVQQKLNQPSSLKRQSTFQYLIPERYEYKLEPALTYLQLQESDFEPRFNRAYHEAQQDIRGGYPYYFPHGWYRHALKVLDKYPDDQVWLGMNNAKGEWAVAYHGTNSNAVRGITDEGLLQSLVTVDAMKAEAIQQNPNIPDVKGLYVATHCEGGASGYAKSFTVKDSTGKNKTYQVVFQCRVQPGSFTIHKSPVTVGSAWRVFDEKAIRPYGLLLKSS